MRVRWATGTHEDTTGPPSTHRRRDPRGPPHAPVQRLVQPLEKLLLDANVVVGDGQHGDPVDLLGHGSAAAAAAAAGDGPGEELLLEQDERALGVLEGAGVAPQLAEDGAHVEVGVGRVVDALEAALDAQGLLQVVRAVCENGKIINISEKGDQSSDPIMVGDVDAAASSLKLTI